MVGRRAFLTVAAFVSPLARALGLAQSFSLDDFITLSSRLTGRTDLNRTAAAALLSGRFSSPGDAARLRQPDAAFEREIIAAWYTGLYEALGERHVATHTGALQWRALGVPAPGVCAGRFGAWSQPPRA